MVPPKSTTKDSLERQFGVNHLAHFVLTALLLLAIAKISTSDFSSRVAKVSSLADRFSPIVWDGLNLDKLDAYQPYVAYGQHLGG